jgi:hypothetical protein
MKYLSLKIPGSSDYIPNTPGLKSDFGDVGSILSNSFSVVFLIAGFLMIFWMSWGVFQYIFAGGDKEALAKARQRITWAIVGFLFIAISFALSQYISTIFPQNSGHVTSVSTPTPKP